jgi:hypothetical protein
MPKIRIDSIEVNELMHVRAAINEEAVAYYAERMQAGDEFPPILVCDRKGKRVVADGFYRLLATKKLGLGKIDADVMHGNRLDAFWTALGTLTHFGVPTTYADVVHALLTAASAFPGKTVKEIEAHIGWSFSDVKAFVNASPKTNESLRLDREAEEHPTPVASGLPDLEDEPHLWIYIRAGVLPDDSPSPTFDHFSVEARTVEDAYAAGRHLSLGRRWLGIPEGTRIRPVGDVVSCLGPLAEWEAFPANLAVIRQAQDHVSANWEQLLRQWYLSGSHALDVEGVWALLEELEVKATDLDLGEGDVPLQKARLRQRLNLPCDPVRHSFQLVRVTETPGEERWHLKRWEESDPEDKSADRLWLYVAAGRRPSGRMTFDACYFAAKSEHDAYDQRIPLLPPPNGLDRDLVVDLGPLAGSEWLLGDECYDRAESTDGRFWATVDERSSARTSAAQRVMPRDEDHQRVRRAMNIAPTARGDT